MSSDLIYTITLAADICTVLGIYLLVRDGKTNMAVALLLFGLVFARIAVQFRSDDKRDRGKS